MQLKLLAERIEAAKEAFWESDDEMDLERRRISRRYLC
jgi:hypothetical protein